MSSSNNLINAIEAALDAGLDDEHFIDDIATRVRPEPWEMAEDRIRFY